MGKEAEPPPAPDAVRSLGYELDLRLAAWDGQSKTAHNYAVLIKTGSALVLGPMVTFPFSAGDARDVQTEHG